MKLLIFSLFAIVIISSCQQPLKSNKQKPQINSLTNENKSIEADSLDLVEPDTKKLREEYIAGYSKPKRFEKTIDGKNNEKIKIYSKYYCLFDSGLIVPARYVWEDTTKKFITHNYADDIVIISNNDTFIKKTITKKDFVNKLPDELKNYAVIFQPKFEGYDSKTDCFNFSFSISIPITDVGQSRNLSIKRNGEVVASGN